MTQLLSNLKVRNLTINSRDVPPKHVRARTPLKHGQARTTLSIKLGLDITSFGSVLLLF